MPEEKIHQITMGVTERELERMRYIQRTYGLQNKAQAVAVALDIAKPLVEHVHGRNRLVLHEPGGIRREFQMPVVRLSAP